MVLYSIILLWHQKNCNSMQLKLAGLADQSHDRPNHLNIQATIAIGSNMVSDWRGPLPSTVANNQFTFGDEICIEMKKKCLGITATRIQQRIDKLGCNIAEIEPSYNGELDTPPEKEKAKMIVMINLKTNSLSSDLIEANFEM